ncbi:MAG: glycogen/starch/alpha-glucan phosphorylase [Kiritimatiellae bacterium]|nr:glycogen/starch/alpha-glucan phosphorylase [Kiritimatiellia bacterium]
MSPAKKKPTRRTSKPARKKKPARPASPPAAEKRVVRRASRSAPKKKAARRASAPARVPEWPEDISRASIKRAILDNLLRRQARFPEVATRNDYYMALAYTVRDLLLHRWIDSAKTYLEQESRTVVYMSAEFLMGPQLGNNLLNLGILDEVRAAVEELDLCLDDLLDQEEEPGLGNGGLGRLAACYMDSLASLQIPSIGYGIRYEFGIFDQVIRDGWQVEVADKWLRLGNPWEIARPEIVFEVKLGGRTEPFQDEAGRYRVRWVPDRVIRGVAYDTPVMGYRVNTANLLRLWKAEASESFDFQAFNVGDYYGAVEDKVYSENISKVLYPNDEALAGKRLRLEQQYFFASCSLQDMLRIYFQREKTPDDFHRKYAVQLNDTHPAIAVAELMRLLVDEYAMEWEQAWEVTANTFAYTNHTLLPEALEKWPVPLFAELLPRHLEIIYEINRRFLDQVRLQAPGDDARAARLSLIDEDGPRYVRMANLSCVGSHSINGVARLHTELLKTSVLQDLHALWPEKINNKTNGITPRRFVALSNPGLTGLINRAIGAEWLRDTERLRALEPYAHDAAFHKDWHRVKHENKCVLAGVIARTTGITVDPASLFDIQVKRIHQYKRQHLNVLNIITLYNRLKRGGPEAGFVPRTCIFAGKAAPGYVMAKLIIKLITSVAEVVNADPQTRDYLKVVFLPDFNVKNAQRVYPAADLSEQISLAGKEASGTGNMKFAFNGALTIGTLDGANVEIREAVGPENFFLFGLTADEVEATRRAGYRPAEALATQPLLREALDMLADGAFSGGDRNLFRPLVDLLVGHDPYMLFADFASYRECQREVSRVFRNRSRWTHMSILNVARVGRFSSDRAIREYCKDIWHVRPVAVHPGTVHV